MLLGYTAHERTNVKDGSAFSLIVMVGSCGATDAFRSILRRLPSNFPAAILCAQHFGALPLLFRPSWKPVSSLPLVEPKAGDTIEAGCIYVMPSEEPLTVAPGGLFAAEAHAGRFAPSADMLIASAAAVYGPRALAVVLSGNLDDGAEGVRRLKRAGGRILAQDQATARRFGMPSASIGTGCVDFVLPAEAIADAVISLVMVHGAADLFRVRLPHWALAPL